MMQRSQKGEPGAIYRCCTMHGSTHLGSEKRRGFPWSFPRFGMNEFLFLLGSCLGSKSESESVCEKSSLGLRRELLLFGRLLSRLLDWFSEIFWVFWWWTETSSLLVAPGVWSGESSDIFFKSRCLFFKLISC